MVVAAAASGACGAGASEARAFTLDALRAAGLGGVEVADATGECRVDDSEGIRTTATTDIGEVSLCVSVDGGRALSVRDPGMTDEQFRRLERYRGETSEDRARPPAAASAVLLLAGVVIQLALRRPPRGRPS